MADDFKNALLSSGLPLEYSAEGVLRRRNFGDVLGDFAFSRVGAQGEMSIDLAAGKRVFSESLERHVNGRLEGLKIRTNWRVLLEAKYRTDNVNWLFAPYDGASDHLHEYGPGRERRTHISFGEEHSSSKVTIQPITLYSGSDADRNLIAPPVCLRGIESRPVAKDAGEKNEAYSAQIRKAARQIQFAIVPYMLPLIRELALRLRADAYGQNRTPRSDRLLDRTRTIFSAYLVTTAAIFVLKPTATIEAIRKASSIEDVGTRVPCVELFTSPSNDLLEHHRTMLRDLRNWTQVDLTIPNERRFFEEWEPVASMIEHLSPSITVVSYEHLERCLEVQEMALHDNIQQSAGSWGKSQGYSWG
jgi:hypothetical protein